jgi:hypothetical protein
MRKLTIRPCPLWLRNGEGTSFEQPRKQHMRIRNGQENDDEHPPEPEPRWLVPEADTLEQKTPIVPDGSEESELMNPLPAEAPEADVMEQRAPVLPGGGRPKELAGVFDTDAAEADIIEQSLTPSFDDEEDYREGREEIG